jgi:hypothetical protein
MIRPRVPLVSTALILEVKLETLRRACYEIREVGSSAILACDLRVRMEEPSGEQSIASYRVFFESLPFALVSIGDGSHSPLYGGTLHSPLGPRLPRGFL